VTIRDLKGVVVCLDKRTEVLELKEMGEPLMRVLGVDILGRGLVIPDDIDRFLKLLIDFYIYYFRIKKKLISH
jgi:hypothetical protein